MAFKGWERTLITRDNGQEVDGIAPVIISASRSTDIPAFYGDQFIERIKRGYLLWVNPFNGVKQYVSFNKTRFIVFWTKNPKPFIPYLSELDHRNIRYIFHFTLNNYECEKFEPDLPALVRRIDTFKILSERIGKERVLWRFDPMILSPTIDVDCLLKKIENIGDQISSHTIRLTVSFLSMYPKVLKNLKRAHCAISEPDESLIKRVSEGLVLLSRKWGIEIVSCAESHDMVRYGIKAGSCVDLEVISKPSSTDSDLLRFLNGHCGQDLFGPDYSKLKKRLKDPGQRKQCNCIVSKDIGRYNTCAHNCLYCYANTSPDRTVMEDIFADP